jgi:hypothetical protein
MTRIAIAVIVLLTLCGIVWAEDGNRPLQTAEEQTGMESRPPKWFGLHLYPMFGQLPDEEIPGGPVSEEARKEFQRQMQEIGRDQHKRRKHLEQFRLLKLLELLDLDESQELRFMKSFTDIRREMREIGDEKKEALDKLGAGLHAGDINDEEIYDLLDRIIQAEKRKRMMFDDFLKEAKSFLTARQVAKLVIFHERFEYELLERVRQFRDRPGASDHPGRRRGPGGLSDG